MKVSICTPTYNRRPFIPILLTCIEQQDYQGELEWVIVDDGTDSIRDLVQHVPFVRYIRIHEKIPLGKKRNLMHANCTGDIIVYMDDDDYYPPTRISHAVDKLTHSNALCAGSSTLHIYFNHLQKIIQMGPYHANHATAGTFAFKKELLQHTSFEEDACLAEEKHFLKNYTVPMVQLDPFHTILVVAHDYNTFDKKKVIGTKHATETNLTVSDFIQYRPLFDFFTKTIFELEYEPGLPEHKPDVLKYTKHLEIANAYSVKINDAIICGDDIIRVLNEQQKRILELKAIINTQSSIIQSRRCLDL